MALTFDYKVRDRSGGLVEGQLDGDSMALVVRRLREMGYMPISVTPKSAVNLKTEIKIPWLLRPGQAPGGGGRHPAALDDGRLRSLGGALARDPGRPGREPRAWPGCSSEVRLDLEHGSSLSAACAKHPKVFSHLFCTLVQAGEVGGNLDEVLGSLAETIEKQAQLNRTIRSAMTYPAVVLSVMLLIFTAMIVFIVPVFQNLFTSLGGKLPFPTQILIKISKIITSPWVLLVIAVIVGGIVGVRKWIATDEGRRKWDRLDAQATRLRASLPQGGAGPNDQHAGVADRLRRTDPRVARHLRGHRRATVTVGDVLLEAKNGVREGRPLADPLREHEDVIPTLVVQMIEVGEQTGALDGMLKKVGEFYDQEVEVTVNNLTALLEPLLTVFMGAMVGAMVICLYLPMFDYIKLVPNWRVNPIGTSFAEHGA